MKRTAILIAAYLCAASARALGPQEILLLVNEQSDVSQEVANHYVKIRNVPLENVVYLNLPDSVLEASAEISRDDFTRYIWEPASRAMSQRGIEDHILAWVYSAGFPVRVATTPPMSLGGLTFTRNAVPEGEDALVKGLYLSPLYAGPDSAQGKGAPAHSLDNFRGHLKGNMPVPSMMLGFTGARGNDTADIVKALARAALADGTLPRGTVHFVLTDDIRSACREWQYAPVCRELKDLDVAAVISSNFPNQSTDVIGLMCGSAWVSPGTVKGFRMGGVPDVLTSFGAAFDAWEQTKLTQWFPGGAAASAGTVTEPLSLWAKFPSARFYSHYAQGCTVLESYYQSIRCPLQILLVGEPLAAPWAARLTLVAVQTDDGGPDSKPTFHGQLFPDVPGQSFDFIWFVDGLAYGVSEKPQIELNPDRLADGHHELRLVAYSKGAVRRQATAICGFTVNRKGRSVRIEGLAAGAKVRLDRRLGVKVTATGTPAKLAVVSGARLLASAAAADSTELSLDPRLLGPGPVTLQPVAYYDDKDVVRGAPVVFEIVRKNEPPSVAVRVTTNGEGRAVFQAEGSDPDGDPVVLSWGQRLFGAVDASGALVASEVETGGAQVEAENGGVRLTPGTEPFNAVFFRRASLAGARDVGARISVVEDWPDIKTQKACLIFDSTDAKNFRFFGLWGDNSSWALGECRDGAIKLLTTRGVPIKPGREYRVAVRTGAPGVVECLVDGEVILRGAGTFGGGLLGLFVTGKAAWFGDISVAPPIWPAAGAFDAKDGRLAAAPSVPGMASLAARASDGAHEAEQAVPALP